MKRGIFILSAAVLCLCCINRTVYHENEKKIIESLNKIEEEISAGTGGVISGDNLKKQKEIISKYKFGETGFAYIIDNNGELIVHPFMEYKKFSSGLFKDLIKKKNGRMTYRWGDKNKVLYFKTIKDSEFIILIGLYEDELNKKAF